MHADEVYVVYQTATPRFSCCAYESLAAKKARRLHAWLCEAAFFHCVISVKTSCVLIDRSIVFLPSGGGYRRVTEGYDNTACPS